MMLTDQNHAILDKSEASSAPIEALSILKDRYKAQKRGYRCAQYRLMAATMATVIEMRADKLKAKNFIEQVKEIYPVGADRKKWLTFAAVAYVMDAKSRDAKKLAWKRARALDYLHDVREIPLEDLAAEIARIGGIEAAAQSAIADNPIRSKKERDKTEDKSKEDVKPKNSRLAAETVGIRIRPRHRKELNKLKTGRRVKLIGVLRDDKIFLDVKKIVPMKSREDDWA